MAERLKNHLGVSADGRIAIQRHSKTRRRRVAALSCWRSLWRRCCGAGRAAVYWQLPAHRDLDVVRTREVADLIQPARGGIVDRPATI